jgi:hypothetical protein
MVQIKFLVLFILAAVAVVPVAGLPIFGFFTSKSKAAPVEHKAPVAPEKVSKCSKIIFDFVTVIQHRDNGTLPPMDK